MELPEFWRLPFRVIEDEYGFWIVVGACDTEISRSKFEDDALVICHALNLTYPVNPIG